MGQLTRDPRALGETRRRLEDAIGYLVRVAEEKDDEWEETEEEQRAAARLSAKAVLVEQHDGRPEPEAMNVIPGTTAKVDLMCRRSKDGLAIFNPDDLDKQRFEQLVKRYPELEVSHERVWSAERSRFETVATIWRYDSNSRPIQVYLSTLLRRVKADERQPETERERLLFWVNAQLAAREKEAALQDWKLKRGGVA